MTTRCTNREASWKQMSWGPSSSWRQCATTRCACTTFPLMRSTGTWSSMTRSLSPRTPASGCQCRTGRQKVQESAQSRTAPRARVYRLAARYGAPRAWLMIVSTALVLVCRSTTMPQWSMRGTVLIIGFLGNRASGGPPAFRARRAAGLLSVWEGPCAAQARTGKSLPRCS